MRRQKLSISYATTLGGGNNNPLLPMPAEQIPGASALMASSNIIAAGAMPIDVSRLRRRAPRLASPRAIYGLIRTSQNECAKQRNKYRRRD